MLKMIMKREFISNLMNLRFSIGLLLTVILTIACVVILTHQYVQELDDYNTRTALADDFLDNYAHTNRIGGMITPQKPPEIFRPFIGGIQWNTEIRSFNENPLPVLFPQFDFLFIVTIIMSLMALLFSYDAVTRERENGTLKLMATNPLSRATIIIGKWLGGMACLLVPLFISLAIGLIYITLHPLVHWDSGV